MRSFRLATILFLMCGAAYAADEKVLRINIAVEPETMDPARNESLAGSRVTKGINENLILLDENAKAIPGIAESWEHDASFTAWTFHLRPDAKWQNGDPLVAEDYVWSLERLYTPSTAAPYASQTMGFIKGAKAFYDGGGLDKQLKLEGVKAIDEHTLQILMEGPTPYFLGVLDLSCFLPVYRKSVEASPDKWAMDPSTYIGNGPFKLAEYKSKSKIVLTKSDTFYDRDKVFFDKVELYMIENPITEEAAFRTDALDITNAVAVQQVAQWRDKPEWNVAPAFATYWVGFNNAVEPFNDPLVRKAFSAAINRKVLTDKVLRRGETVATGLIPAMLDSPTGKKYRDVAGTLVPAFNPEEAKRLLKEAGYGPGGKPFPQVTYVYDTNDEHKAIGEQLQAMWKGILGVDVKLENSDWGTYLSRGRTHDFTMLRRRWYGDYIDVATFTDLWGSDSTLNYEQYKNPKYAEALANAKKETDPVKREQFLAEAEKLLVGEDCAIAPLFNMVTPMLMKTNITGVIRNATGTLDYTRARRTAPL